MVIFCDSACDLWKKQIEEWDVKQIDFPFMLDGEEQKNPLETPEDFDNYFVRLKQGVIPSTASINAHTFKETFEPYLKEGKDVLYIHLSGALTSTFNSLKMAIDELKEEYPKRKICAVDSLHVSMGIGLLVYRAVKMQQAGKTMEEIVSELEFLKNKISCFFAVDDLFFLKKGGRISLLQAIGGTMLGVKPILKCSEMGKIVKVLNVKGRKAVIKQLLYYLETLGENAADFPIVIMHANNQDMAQELKNAVENMVGTHGNIWIQPVGPTIGTHCGPGTLAIVFRSRIK